MRCPHCGHDNPVGELFCDNCRRTLPRPTAGELDATYRAQDSARRKRLRRDATHAVVWGLVAGLGSLALANLIATWGEPGDLWMVAAGRQAWWLIGLFWGTVIWGLRRGFSTER
jgi:hypothetical protein